MADWSPETSGLTWPQNRLEERRQKRLADFVRPHLHSDEQIVAVLPGLHEWPTRWLRVALAPMALVVTSQRLFDLRQGHIILLRSTKILGIYPRDELKIEWSRDAYVSVSGPYEYSYGKLRVIGSFGAKDWWAGGSWRQHRVATVAYDTGMAI